ncbi:MFS transporter [Ferroacidibacillus organovorans]|nr:MFS transporter [Ferroacidibacillus organovorans]
MNVEGSNDTAAARLERLPISSFHLYIMWVLAFAFFFELGDINTLSYTAPAILKNWHLGLSGIGNIVSATFLGMFLGATIIGWVSDRIGRKKSLIFTILLFSVFSLLNAFAVNFVMLFITRLVTGIGLSAMTVVGITYISEMFPAKKRGSFQGWIMTIGLAGIPITAFVARFLIPSITWGWRLVYIWGALGFIFAILAVRLKESPRWHENHGRTAEADRILSEIEMEIRAEKGELPAPTAQIPTAQSNKGYNQLFSSGNVGKTIMFMVVWIAQTLGFYGFMAWVPTLLVSHGFSLVTSLAWSSAISIGAVPGAFIAAVLSDRVERKWLISIVAVIIAVCGVLYGISFNTAAIIVFGFLVAMLIQTFAPLLYAYTPEMYPTEIRNSGAGLTYGVGRLANVFGPQLVVFFYTGFGYLSVFVYIAVCWLVVAVVIGIWGAKTRARALESVNVPSQNAVS